MRFRLHTLVDITQTNARAGSDPFELKQQQNFLTVFQTISMRANPVVNRKPTVEEKMPSSLNFGKQYKQKSRVWTLEFEFETAEAHSIELLKTDFEFVPFIDKLSESVKFDHTVFIANDNNFQNIVFEIF